MVVHVDADSAPWSLHHADVGIIADILEVLAASIFRAKVQ
jgi:hypothetical protein